MVSEGFEKTFLISWEGWDELDMMDIQFYNAILRKDVFLHLLPDFDFDRCYDVAFLGSNSKIEISIDNQDSRVLNIAGMKFSHPIPA